MATINSGVANRAFESQGFQSQRFQSRFGLEYAPTSFLVRFGKRELLVCRDFRKRFYAVNPVIECDTGVQPGHIEILLFGRWLLILSKAH